MIFFPTLRRALPLACLAGAAAAAGCSGHKKYDPAKARLNKYVDVPARVLYERARAMLEKPHRFWPFKKELHRTAVPREMFMEVMRRPDAGELRELAEVRVADTFRIEASDLGYAEAIARYKTFLQYHPTHPLAEEAQWHLAACFYEQRSGPGRDQSMARNAETELNFYKQKYPAGAHAAEVDAMVAGLVDARAHHEQRVGDFYLERRAPAGGESRIARAGEISPPFKESAELALSRGRLAMAKNDPDGAKGFFVSALARPLAADGSLGAWGPGALKQLRAKEKAEAKARRKAKAPEPPKANADEKRAAYEAAARKKGETGAALAGWLDLLSEPFNSDGRVSAYAGKSLRAVRGLRLKKHGAALCWPDKPGCEGIAAGQPKPDAAPAPANPPKDRENR